MRRYSSEPRRSFIFYGNQDILCCGQLILYQRFLEGWVSGWIYFAILVRLVPCKGPCRTENLWRHGSTLFSHPDKIYATLSSHIRLVLLQEWCKKQNVPEVIVCSWFERYSIVGNQAITVVHWDARIWKITELSGRSVLYGNAYGLTSK